MNKFVSIINNGYSSNFKVVTIPFKKKYIYILNKLIRYNCIINFKIDFDKKKIAIFLKYYNNKPLFRLKMESSNSNKKYCKIYKIKKNNRLEKNNFGFTLNLFSTNFGFLTNDEIIFKNVGGNNLLKIELLHFQ